MFFKCANPRIKRNRKRQENMVPSKEQDQSPENDTTKMEIFELPDKEFKIIVEFPGDPGVRT